MTSDIIHDDATTVTYGTLSVDTTTRYLVADGKNGIRLTTRECQLFSLLVKHQGKSVSRDMIMTHLYGHASDTEPELKVIDVFICKLRKKMRDIAATELIETVWGRGYRLPAIAPLMAA